MNGQYFSVHSPENKNENKELLFVTLITFYHHILHLRVKGTNYLLELIHISSFFKLVSFPEMYIYRKIEK